MSEKAVTNKQTGESGDFVVGVVAGLLIGMMLMWGFCAIVATPTQEEATRLTRGEFPEASIVAVSKAHFFVIDGDMCYRVRVSSVISPQVEAEEVDCPRE